jgi:hypothetical protein
MGAPTRLITAGTGPYLNTEKTKDQKRADHDPQVARDETKLPVTLIQGEIHLLES